MSADNYSDREATRDQALAEFGIAIIRAGAKVRVDHGLTPAEWRTVQLRMAADLIHMANKGLRRRLPR